MRKVHILPMALVYTKVLSSVSDRNLVLYSPCTFSRKELYWIDHFNHRCHLSKTWSHARNNLYMPFSMCLLTPRGETISRFKPHDLLSKRCENQYSNMSSKACSYQCKMQRDVGKLGHIPWNASTGSRRGTRHSITSP